MHVGDGLDRVVEAVAALSAVAEDLVVLHPTDHMLHPRTHLAVGGVVLLLARQQGQEVRWLARRNATGIALPGNDFWLFDSSLLLVNHFDGEGEWLETSTSTDPHEVQLCADAFEAVWELGVPHSDYRIV